MQCVDRVARPLNGSRATLYAAYNRALPPRRIYLRCVTFTIAVRESFWKWCGTQYKYKGVCPSQCLFLRDSTHNVSPSLTAACSRGSHVFANGSIWSVGRCWKLTDYHRLSVGPCNFWRIKDVQLILNYISHVVYLHAITVRPGTYVLVYDFRSSPLLVRSPFPCRVQSLSAGVRSYVSRPSDTLVLVAATDAPR